MSDNLEMEMEIDSDEFTLEFTNDDDENRDKLCIQISEGCLRHHNEEPEIEDQFILRLPEAQAFKLHEVLDSDTLGERLTIKMDKNLREAELQFDNTVMRGVMMTLPTIVESQKMADEATLFKSADISQILVCNSIEDEEPSTSAAAAIRAAEAFKIDLLQIKYGSQFPHGLCPPLKNAPKNRFRKKQLEESFNPDVDRAVKLLLRADGAAESVRYEIFYENDGQSDEFSGKEAADTESCNVSEFEVFGEDIAMLMTDDEATTESDTDTDSDIGTIDKYDLDTLTDEQKEHVARLTEINWSLSNICMKSPPPQIRPMRIKEGCRGRGRPRKYPAGNETSVIQSPPESCNNSAKGKRGRPRGSRNKPKTPPSPNIELLN